MKGKIALREEIIQKRRALGREEIASQSEQLAAYVSDWPVFVQASTVMLYAALADEPQTGSLMRYSLSCGKQVCIPHIGERDGCMEAAVLRSLDELKIGQYNIMTVDPATRHILDPAALDLVIVPGVAFDYTGRRCGMGGGYYDRFLPKAPQAVWAGMAFSCQMVAAVPCQPHDQALHYIITSAGIIAAKSGLRH